MGHPYEKWALNIAWDAATEPAKIAHGLEKLSAHQLEHVLTAITRRCKAIVLDSSYLVAELSLDNTRFDGPRGEAHYRELELEFRRGDLTQFRYLANTLRERLDLQPSGKSKFVVGMELVGQ